jgi:hypothetical protein
MDGVTGRPRPPRVVRLAAWAGVVAVLLAMLGPPLRRPPVDSYPLSTYPMFSSDRGRLSSVATVVGVGADGAVRRLSPHLIGGNDEVMLSVQTVADAVRAGADRSGQLCHQVAERVGGSGLGDELVEVVVRTEVHDAVDHFAGDRTPLEVEDHARCEVPVR